MWASKSSRSCTNPSSRWARTFAMTSTNCGAEIYRMRRELVGAADRAGLSVAAAGTHPFSSWIDQVILAG